jgi:TonB family protein
MFIGVESVKCCFRKIVIILSMRSALTFLVLIFLIVPSAYAQCTTHISASTDDNNQNYFRFHRAISSQINLSGTSLRAFGITHENSVVALFMSEAGKFCGERGDTIMLEFTDGKQMRFLNDNDNNCENKFAIFFGGEYGKLEKLDTLKAKTLSRVTLTHKGIKASATFTSSSGEEFRNALRCLHDTFASDALAKELIAKKENSVFLVVEQQPEYPGGYGEMMTFIRKNLKKVKSSGTVYVTFVIDKQGNVTEPEVETSLSPEADTEALRLVKSMPRWKPGFQNGKPVFVKFKLPIKFR